jgi:hypothetical protein
MKYNRFFLATAMLMATASVTAQELTSAYFTQDYKFRHDMNPAYGNDQNYVSIPALGNINVRMQGNFGVEDVLFQNPATGKYDRTFMHPDVSVSDALSGFNSGDNKVIADVNVAILSAGFKSFGGYNTVEINSRTTVGVCLPYELFRFAKNLNNDVYDIGDINARAQSYVELAFGHSRNIDEKLRVGAKLKLLFGVARADVSLENMKAEMAAGSTQWIVSGQAKANMMMKGFTYKTKTKEYEKRPGTYTYVNDADVDGAGLGGFGLALDLGATYKVMDELTVSAAVSDLGFINWSNNMQASNHETSFLFSGFQDVSIAKSSPNSMKNQANNYKDQLADFANLTDDGDQGSVSKALAATVRVGAEYQLPMYRQMAFGLLAQHRFNGPFSWTEARLSANWTPLNWLNGGLNTAVGTYGASAGWVLNVHPKGYNFFIGMDHILAKATKQFVPLSSKASINLGMNITF